ncbi:NADPH:quinone reductase [Oceanicaulis sp. MMSF_3324]|uniref:NADPH:quinone reductase n=1 Tax=Oceanicaulis sp. MMSF_3324 TaxID=3046702 RepID=UPI002740197F|nr:NADPH:quinone reductase [Oceanicaulis sp. MMSF_3324]
MRAIWYEAQGAADDVLTLGERPDPQPGPGEVAVFIKASGVNPSDVKTRAGLRAPMSVARQIPHSDGAGVIRAVGEGVDPARIGERVFVFNAAFKRAGGTCAEICVVPVEFTGALPDAVSFDEGAALGIPALTAHRALTTNGSVTGKTVLITGGAGAVGLQAIQLAKWMGAGKVITTVSGPEKAEAALDAGADEVVNYRQQDVVDAIEAMTEGEGVDHIVEVEFGGNLAASVALIRPHGMIASYGSEAEKTPELPFYDLMFKNAAVQSVFVYTLTPAQRASAVQDVTRALADGALKPRIDSVYALEDCADAHKRVEAGDKIGSVIVTPA